MKFTHYTRLCRMCGAEMQGVGSRKLYCPDCLALRRKEQWMRKYSQERNRKRREQSRLKADSGAQRIRAADHSIDEIVRDAAAAGWSYGRQVAHAEGRCRDVRKPLPPLKPNPFRCPIRAPKPRDCAWCAHREDRPRRTDLPDKSGKHCLYIR